jgi:three-Cys-motif partner protein
MKDIEYYKGREQTYLKHFFLEKYLETLAYHIGFSQKEFVYVDCFSGPWRQGDVELGDTSIRIALDRLNAVRSGLGQKGKHPKIRAIFIEKKQQSFHDLKNALQEHRGDVEALALQGSFEENIARIADEAGGAFTFLFVDPTGWTGFTMETIGPILRAMRGEVMINFMFDFINRFRKWPSPANQKSLDLLFGTVEWRKMSDRPDPEIALVELYGQQVRKAGNFNYVTSTRILKPLQDRSYFYLIYATRSATGIEKFREVERKALSKQDEAREKAQRDHRVERTGQTALDFGFDAPMKPGIIQDQRHFEVQKAQARVEEILRTGPIAFENLMGQVLQIPLVWKNDLTKILVEGHRSGRLRIEGLGPRERTPKPTSTIRWLA